MIDSSGKLRYPFALALLVAVAGLFSGCGDTGLGGPGNDLSGIGAKTDPGWHTSYLVGAHGGYACGDCHVSAARTNFREISGDQICARCHMDAYNRTGLFNHASYKIGTHCNACHFSDSFTAHTRVSHGAYHGKIAANCLSCHPGKTPASHYSDGRTANCESCHKYPSWAPSGGAHTYTSGCARCHSGKKPGSHGAATYATCENCHKYPSWKGATFTHSGISSGCASCHSRHYGGYACEACHTSGISWRYRHSQVRADGCIACHAGGNFDDDDDDHEGGDDD